VGVETFKVDGMTITLQPCCCRYYKYSRDVNNSYCVACGRAFK
jgi:hypothetical protein